MTPTIDPIVIKERLARMRQQQETLRRADAAADALLWFKEHGFQANHRDRIDTLALKGAPQIVASATAYAKEAQAYIDRAATAFNEQIIARAMQMADADMRRADAINNVVAQVGA